MADRVLFQTKIRLTKRALGARPKPTEGNGNKNIMRFQRDRANNWAWNLDSLAEAAKAATKDLNLECDPDSLMFPLTIELGQLAFFRRLYKITGDQRQHAQEHESIPNNYILTFTLRIREDGSTLPTPNPEQLLQILNYIGEYEGISEWGRERGYGRFTVESLSLVERIDASPGKLPERSGGDPPVHGKEDDQGNVGSPNGD